MIPCLWAQKWNETLYSAGFFHILFIFCQRYNFYTSGVDLGSCTVLDFWVTDFANCQTFKMPALQDVLFG